MQHVYLTCRHHQHLRWMCKEIAFTEGHGYNGTRNIFYLGTKIEGKSTLECECKERECDCSPSDLIKAPEQDHS